MARGNAQASSVASDSRMSACWRRDGRLSGLAFFLCFFFVREASLPYRNFQKAIVVQSEWTKSIDQLKYGDNVWLSRTFWYICAFLFPFLYFLSQLESCTLYYGIRIARKAAAHWEKAKYILEALKFPSGLLFCGARGRLTTAITVVQLMVRSKTGFDSKNGICAGAGSKRNAMLTVPAQRSISSRVIYCTSSVAGLTPQVVLICMSSVLRQSRVVGN